MSDVPSNLIPTRITGLPEYLGTSTLGYLPYVIEGNTYKVQFANIAAVGAVPSTREINTGSGLGGGGDLSANRTLYILPGGVDDSRLSATGVTAGTYGAADSIPVFTVNAQGRVTGVTNTPIVLSGYVPTSRTITAGAGLTGGGDLSANRTLAVNFSSTTPEPLGPGSSGVSTVAAREDHVHPAVDLSDTTETQGVLPLSRGGTGNSLSPVVGAIAYSSNDRLNLTPTSGNAGDVLVSAGGVAPPFWQAPIGGGTVTSINASGGTTGMSFTGGPITTFGTLTLGGTLGVANGGTGAADAATALTNLGAYPASNPAGYTSNVGTVTSVSGTGTVSGLSLSGTVTSAGSLTLGGTLVVTPSNFASQSANTVLAAPNGSAGVPTFRAIVAADIPTLNQNTTGTAGNVSGIVAVVNGGTGASVAGTARTNLGAAASGANTDITSIALTTGTISATPTNGTDIVNKTYADSIASGINFHQSVRLATAAALPANTYNNGASGVGATLTANANAALSVDGVAVVVGNRILVKNEVAQANNGVYTVTQTGSGAAPYILTRATDFDSSGSGVDQIDAGDFFLVTAGSTQSNTSWVQQTPLPITVGTTALVFTQFAAPVLYSAGTGLTLAGTVFSITNTGVSASTYGSASSVPVLAINAQGQVTSASASSIAIAASQITSGTVSVAQGGTGATTLTANGVLLGNGTSAISATAVGSTGQVLVGNTGGAPSWATLSGIGVTSFSAGTTGLTPSSGTTGAITLAGTLNVANGGTGATSLTSGYLVKGNGTSAASASVVYDDGTNVGIGTTSPSYRVQAVSATDYQGYFRNSTPNTGVLIGGVSGGGILTSDSSGTALLFGIGGTERARIDSSGNFGIGTSSPGGTYGKLTVAGGVRTTDDTSSKLELGRYSAGAPNSYIKLGTNSSSLRFTNAGDTADLMSLTNTGDLIVGGTSVPSLIGGGYRQLVVGGSVGGAVDIGTTSTSYGRVSGDSSGLNVEALGATFTAFRTNGSERMRIDSSGNVGIGTTTPIRPLHAFYNSSVVGAYTAVLQGAGGGYGAGVSFQSVLTGGSLAEMARITADGESSWNTTASTQDAGLRFYTALDGTVAERMRVAADGTTTLNIGGVSSTHQFNYNESGGEIQLIDSTGAGPILIDNVSGLARFYKVGSGAVSMGTTGANYFQFITNGSERMRIDVNGLVGIGTSAPASLLHVKRGSNATEVYPSGTWASRIINATDGSGENGLVVGNRWAASSSTVFEVGSIYGGGTGSWRSFYKVDGVGNSIWSNDGTERMRINSSGFVGIGTSSPQVRLQVSSADQSESRLRLQNTGSGGTTFDIVSGNPGVSNAGLAFYDATNAATRMYITSGGNVGIGNTDPGYRLDVAAADTTSGLGYAARLRSNATATAAALQFTNSGVTAENGLIACTDAGRITVQGSTDMAFRTNGAERARITSAGYLLVGTTATLGGNTSNEFKTTTAGSWPLTINSNDRGILHRQSSATTGFYEYFEYNGGTNNGSISYSGGTTAYNTTSDARIKKNIVDAPDAGSLIDAIKVRSWDFKADDVHWRYGMVAQELLPVAPEAVTVPEDEEMMMGVDYAKLVPMLIKEVQSLRARVAQLEGN